MTHTHVCVHIPRPWLVAASHAASTFRACASSESSGPNASLAASTWLVGVVVVLDGRGRGVGRTTCHIFCVVREGGKNRLITHCLGVDQTLAVKPQRPPLFANFLEPLYVFVFVYGVMCV